MLRVFHAMVGGWRDLVRGVSFAGIWKIILGGGGACFLLSGLVGFGLAGAYQCSEGLNTRPRSEWRMLLFCIFGYWVWVGWVLLGRAYVGFVILWVRKAWKILNNQSPWLWKSSFYFFHNSWFDKKYI